MFNNVYIQPMLKGYLFCPMSPYNLRRPNKFRSARVLIGIQYINVIQSLFKTISILKAYFLIHSPKKLLLKMSISNTKQDIQLLPLILRKPEEAIAQWKPKQP